MTDPTISIYPSHRTDGHRVTMRRDPVCTTTDPNYDRAYDALLRAMEKINSRTWAASVAAHRKKRKRGLPSYTPPESAQYLADQIERLIRCRITPEEALASLHEYSVFADTYGK
jgi:hypothetical protein